MVSTSGLRLWTLKIVLEVPGFQTPELQICRLVSSVARGSGAMAVFGGVGNATRLNDDAKRSDLKDGYQPCRLLCSNDGAASINLTILMLRGHCGKQSQVRTAGEAKLAITSWRCRALALESYLSLLRDYM